MGQIDSATTTELILLYHHRKPGDALPGSWRASVEATLALIETDELRFAPGTVGSSGRTVGPYEVLAKSLAAFGLRGGRELSATRREQTMAATRKWASQNIWQLRENREAIRSESETWLEEIRRHSWPNHRVMHGALFDEHFIPQLAVLANIGRADVRRLWELSGEETAVRRFTTASNAKGGDLDVVADLYLYAWLMRGRYHDLLAERTGTQILHHAFRHGVLDPLATESRELEVPPVSFFLAAIIVGDAFAAKRVDERIARWCESVALARVALLKRRGARTIDDEERARGAAVQAAIDCGIGSSPNLLAGVLDEILRFGFAVPLSSFVVERFAVPPGIVAGYAHAVLEHVMAPVKRGAEDVLRRRRLDQLSRLWPGRIERLWRERS